MIRSLFKVQGPDRPIGPWPDDAHTPQAVASPEAILSAVPARSLYRCMSLILCCLVMVLAFSQELVLNGGFELLKKCPKGSSGGGISALPYLRDPKGGAGVYQSC